MSNDPPSRRMCNESIIFSQNYLNYQPENFQEPFKLIQMIHLNLISFKIRISSVNQPRYLMNLWKSWRILKIFTVNHRSSSSFLFQFGLNVISIHKESQRIIRLNFNTNYILNKIFSSHWFILKLARTARYSEKKSLRASIRICRSWKDSERHLEQSSAIFEDRCIQSILFLGE